MLRGLGVAEGREIPHEGISFEGTSANAFQGGGLRARFGKRPGSDADAAMRTQNSPLEATVASDSLAPSCPILVPYDSVDTACQAVLAGCPATASQADSAWSPQAQNVVQEHLTAEETGRSTAVIVYSPLGPGIASIPVLPAAIPRLGPQALSSRSPTASCIPGTPPKAQVGNAGPNNDVIEPLQRSSRIPSRLQFKLLDISRFEDAVSMTTFAAAAAARDNRNSTMNQQYEKCAAHAASPTRSSYAFTAPQNSLSRPSQQLHTAHSHSALQCFAEEPCCPQQQLLNVDHCSHRSRLNNAEICSISNSSIMSPQRPSSGEAVARESRPLCGVSPPLSQAVSNTLPDKVLISVALSHMHIV
jgi:hypothetical protein